MAALADVRKTITQPQLEVLALLASGYSMVEIAEIKFMHVKTVHQRIRSARERVGAASTTHLVVLCFEAGVIERNGHGYQPIQLDERAL